MKRTTWALLVITLVLLGHVQISQGADSRIWGWIYTQDGKLFRDFSSGPRTTYLYPGVYTISLLVANDNLGCSLRLGTKSSNTKRLTISGPLAVRNVTNPLNFFKDLGKDVFRAQIHRLPFKCGTRGTIRVFSATNAVVPVMVTLTYGPFLTKTHPMVVTNKLGIKSVSTLPTRRSYSLNQRVSMTLNLTRQPSSKEGVLPTVYWRVREGKLCKVGNPNLNVVVTANNEWKHFKSGHDFARSDSTFKEFANLCHRGRTLVEFGWPDEEVVNGRHRMMTDSRIKRVVFNVGKRTAPTRRIRSRGIDNPPPLIFPDPIPPALPNFELQGESAKEK